jgi:hypothetical protein
VCVCLLAFPLLFVCFVTHKYKTVTTNIYNKAARRRQRNLPNPINNTVQQDAKNSINCPCWCLQWKGRRRFCGNNLRLQKLTWGLDWERALTQHTEKAPRLRLIDKVAKVLSGDTTCSFWESWWTLQSLARVNWKGCYCQSSWAGQTGNGTERATGSLTGAVISSPPLSAHQADVHLRRRGVQNRPAGIIWRHYCTTFGSSA